MCGIVGAVAQRDVSEILVEGLRRLEYRGYDSAGLALLDEQGNMQRVRRLGKVKALSDAVSESGVEGKIGIAHTRWATHGEPSEINAHPHISNGTLAVVHNGIIENHNELREKLKGLGYEFLSQTDTEVIVHLVHHELTQTDSLLKAVQRAATQLEGAYGTVVLDKNNPDRLVVARSGSPLVIGYGIGETFLASDQLALLPVTRRFSYLEEGDVAEITRKEVRILDASGKLVERAISESTIEHDAGGKAGYRHFMEKEIFEQPAALRHTLADRVSADGVNIEAFGKQGEALLSKVEHVQIVACGTSYNSGMVARYWLEELAGVTCNVEIASEFRYRKSVVRPNSLFVTLSQSGETADTLAALRIAKEMGYMSSLSICNVPGSSLVRESDLAFMTKAGVEIGVASSKAFTTQLIALLLLTLSIGRLQKRISPEKESETIAELKALPEKIEQMLQASSSIEALAADFADKQHALFLGRGDQYPIAMEGALKLKEISYIHAEAYAAGELKHGPLALIDSEMPVIVVAPDNELLEKLHSNVEEVRARGGLMYVFADQNAGFKSDDTMQVLEVPHCAELVAPILYTVPLQLLSYHAALIKGTDVDQPRNLAKAVTVE